jgi:hypothetical protein
VDLIYAVASPYPKAQTARLWLAMMQLQQGFAGGGMGFNDKFALQKS